ncbi:hypothetical protein AB0I52_22765 [Streptomyces sp. NPDC050423]|uniref:phosphatase PAP2 family protein n=1 Tax=Streptomyces sp. NPDC050423 TaxID=3155402 RepID=UPI003413EE97
MMFAGSRPADREPDSSARPPLVRELLLVVGLFVIHKFGRRAADGHVDEAFHNAGRVGLVVATRSRWRRLWLLYPAITLFVLVGTASHYWLDWIVVAALLPAVLSRVREVPSGLRLPRAEPVRAHIPWPAAATGYAVPAQADRHSSSCVPSGAGR